jgi:hypothetical protein
LSKWIVLSNVLVLASFPVGMGVMNIVGIDEPEGVGAALVGLFTMSVMVGAALIVSLVVSAKHWKSMSGKQRFFALCPLVLFSLGVLGIWGLFAMEGLNDR